MSAVATTIAAATGAPAVSPLATPPSGLPNAPGPLPTIPFRAFLMLAETRSALCVVASKSPEKRPTQGPHPDSSHARAHGAMSAAHAARDRNEEDEDPATKRRRSALSDAMAPSPPASTFVPPLASPTADARQTALRAQASASLEEVFPALVRRIAWSGDGRRGSARVEIGAGDLAGSTLLVHAEEGRVRVQLDVPAGADARAWQKRIAQRLADHGIEADAVEVT